MVEQAEKKSTGVRLFHGIGYPKIIGRIEQWVLMGISEGTLEVDEATLALGDQALEYLRRHNIDLADIVKVLVWERKPEIIGFSTQKLHPEKYSRMPNSY